MGICQGYQPDAGGSFTYHAPQATPIHYMRSRNGWEWSADRVRWQSVSDPTPAGGRDGGGTRALCVAYINPWWWFPRRMVAGGIFGLHGAQLVDQNLAICAFLKAKDPRPCFLPVTTISVCPRRIVDQAWACPLCRPATLGEMPGEPPTTPAICSACAASGEQRRPAERVPLLRLDSMATLAPPATTGHDRPSDTPPVFSTSTLADHTVRSVQDFSSALVSGI